MWVSSWFDEDSVYHAGYWEPLADKPGHVWVPGWFDGTTWALGYWVTDAEYGSADLEAWQPEPGWNDGWDADDEPTLDEVPDLPLAVPVTSAAE